MTEIVLVKNLGQGFAYILFGYIPSWLGKSVLNSKVSVNGLFSLHSSQLLFLERIVETVTEADFCRFSEF